MALGEHEGEAKAVQILNSITVSMEVAKVVDEGSNLAREGKHVQDKDSNQVEIMATEEGEDVTKLVSTIGQATKELEKSHLLRRRVNVKGLPGRRVKQKFMQ
ncbi:hypothetical protein GOP47_0022358 [Adiantum capillus-veneris]|uniref:Uncharacterized protein n=1 Tax=Adiantum capillus-veneris TaxID=13818 RepID=A0A9D4U564_ADICA|nr:hypothetical protein GOP47_0022358 [Adiantum capillus-veneris]